MSAQSTSNVERLNTLRSLAAEQRWPEIWTLLEDEKGALFPEIVQVLSEMGDRYAAARAWGDAVHCYHFGLWPSIHRTRRRLSTSKMEQLAMVTYPLYIKFEQARSQAARKEPRFQESVSDEAISLALLGRFDHAQEILNWLTGSLAAANFERAADQLALPDQRDTILWLLSKAEEGYQTAGAYARKRSEVERLYAEVERIRARIDAFDYQPEVIEEEVEPEEDVEPVLSEVFAQLEALARRKEFDVCRDLLRGDYARHSAKIAAHYEALGDAYRERTEVAAALEMYSLALAASLDPYVSLRLRNALKDVVREDLEDKIAHPIPRDASLPDPLGWENGLDRVERLALAGRRAAAEALLDRLRATLPDAGDLRIATAEHYEEVARLLARQHPKIAAWFESKDASSFAPGPPLSRETIAEDLRSVGALGDGEYALMVPLIERMETWLAQNRPDYFARLQAGVTARQLDAFEAQFDLTLPTAFRALYQWRNGQDEACLESLEGNRMFMSLESIAGTKRGLDAMIETEFEEPEWWRRGWVPFLENGGGDCLCMDLTAEDDGTPGQLRAFWHDEDRRDIEYGDLKEWLTELVESMENETLELF